MLNVFILDSGLDWELPNAMTASKSEIQICAYDPPTYWCEPSKAQ